MLFIISHENHRISKILTILFNDYIEESNDTKQCLQDQDQKNVE